MEKKNVVFLTVLAVATLLTAIVGTTFAWFSVSITNATGGAPTETNIQSATLALEYNDGTPVVTANDIVPGWTASKTITVENKGTIPVKYRIDWTGVTNTFETENDGTDDVDNFVYSVTASTTDTSDTSFGNTYKKTDAVMPGMTGGSTVFVEDVTIAANKKHTYVITFDYKYGNYDQNVNQNRDFRATFQLSAASTTATTNTDGGATYTYPATVAPGA